MDGRLKALIVFFFFLVIGNKINIINEKRKEKKIHGVHDDEHKETKIDNKEKEIKRLF